MQTMASKTKVGFPAWRVSGMRAFSIRYVFPVGEQRMAKRYRNALKSRGEFVRLYSGSLGWALYTQDEFDKQMELLAKAIHKHPFCK